VRCMRRSMRHRWKNPGADCWEQRAPWLPGWMPDASHPPCPHHFHSHQHKTFQRPLSISLPTPHHTRRAAPAAGRPPLGPSPRGGWRGPGGAATAPCTAGLREEEAAMAHADVGEGGGTERRGMGRGDASAQSITAGPSGGAVRRERTGAARQAPRDLRPAVAVLLHQHRQAGVLLRGPLLARDVGVDAVAPALQGWARGEALIAGSGLAAAEPAWRWPHAPARSRGEWFGAVAGPCEPAHGSPARTAAPFFQVCASPLRSTCCRPGSATAPADHPLPRSTRRAAFQETEGPACRSGRCVHRAASSQLLPSVPDPPPSGGEACLRVAGRLGPQSPRDR
jgi:hypothetical protein